MAKKTINLILDVTPEHPTVVRVKKILPIIAGVLLILFLFSYAASFIYLKQNIDKFNRLKTETDAISKNISSLKETETAVRDTSSYLSIIEQIEKSSLTYSKILTTLQTLNFGPTTITGIELSQKGEVSVTVKSNDYLGLDSLVKSLHQGELDKLYKNIKIAGISRDRKGIYLLTLLLKTDSINLQ